MNVKNSRENWLTSPTILHVPYSFVPGELGGTEIYTLSLLEELETFGWNGEIAAPGKQTDFFHHDGVAISYFGMDPDRRIGYAQPDKVAASSFRDLLHQRRPDVVHLHARTSVVSELLLQEAHDWGAKTVVTYHSPTISCIRGTMMYGGVEVCDGRLLTTRCASCALQQYELPRVLADTFANSPSFLGKALTVRGMNGGTFLPLRMRYVVEDNHRQFRNFVSMADRVVAVCDWVADVLRRNGVEEPKLVVNRQGVSKAKFHKTSKPVGSSPKRSLRLGYFGRVHPTKGIDTLIKAIGSVPNAGVSLDVFGVIQPGNEQFSASLKRLSDGDQRIRFRHPVSSDEVSSMMSDFDMIAVPSNWLETGPLVVLEAFSAGVPVLGSRLGGISELVTDEVDGLLVSPGDSDAWASAILRVSQNPDLLRMLQRSVKPPRTMTDAAREMVDLYSGLFE